MRILVDALLRGGDAHVHQQLERLRSSLLLVQLGVIPQILTDLKTDGLLGIQRRHRFLKDHRHVVPTQRTHLFPIALQLIDSNIALVTVISDGAALNAGQLRQKLHDTGGRHALAAAGLADDT